MSSVLIEFLHILFQLPIIDTDWWEPIYTVDTENVIGQVQILLALGTEEQINNLKLERGFASNVVTANLSTNQPQARFETRVTEKLNIQQSNYRNKFRYENTTRDFLQFKSKNKPKHSIVDRNSDLNNIEETKSPTVTSRLEQKNNLADKAVNTLVSPEKVDAAVAKSDIGTQSNFEMDKKVEAQDKTKISPTQEMLGNFLNQLMAQRQKNISVENSTNTEVAETVRSNCSQNLQDAQNNTNLKLRKTTDLLDSLQKALSLDSVPDYKSSEKTPGNIL